MDVCRRTASRVSRMLVVGFSRCSLLYGTQLLSGSQALLLLFSPHLTSSRYSPSDGLIVYKCNGVDEAEDRDLAISGGGTADGIPPSSSSASSPAPASSTSRRAVSATTRLRRAVTSHRKILEAVICLQVCQASGQLRNLCGAALPPTPPLGAGTLLCLNTGQLSVAKCNRRWTTSEAWRRMNGVHMCIDTSTLPLMFPTFDSHTHAREFLHVRHR